MIKASVLLGTVLFTVLFSPLSVKELQQQLNCPEAQAKNLTIEDITFLEDEEEIELGFETADYLPINFNAYEGMELNLEEIPFIEAEDEFILGFDTSDYLPQGFNAYDKPEFNLIIYFEEDDNFILEFDTDLYLPKGFNPNAK